MESPTLPNNASIQISDQAPTSHATGDNLISDAAHFSNSQNNNSIIRSTNEHIDPKTVDQNIRKLEPFDAIQDNFGTREHNAEGGPEDDDSVDTAWSESTTVPRRKLGFIQVVSLILNTTIGSGIFNTPGYVLALTRSKRVSLILWAVGGIYSALRYILFLENFIESIN